MIGFLRNLFRPKATDAQIKVVVNEINDLIKLYGIDPVTWAVDTIGDKSGKRQQAIATLARIRDGQKRREMVTELVKTLGYITEAKENYYHNDLEWPARYQHWLKTGHV